MPNGCNVQGARESILRVYRELIIDGHHRPGDLIENCEAALSDLGMTEGEIEAIYVGARER